MKVEISCPILSGEKFSKEALTDIVDSLEKLENCKNTIFNRLNTAFSERVNKLCDIKARINRANQIIASYTSINEAITLKSKYHYPNKNHIFYSPTIIDQNATTINKEPTLKLNRIVLNDKNKLGSKSLAAKDKIVTYDKYLSFSTQFNDIVNELDKVENQVTNARQSLEEFEPILNNVTSDFNFGTNLKIEYAKKQQYNPQQDVNRGSSIVLQEFMKEKQAEEEKRKKIIQKAPKSIIEKVKLKKYKKKRNKLKKGNSSKITFNLPTNIGLGGVAELADGEDEEEKNEDKNEDEEDEDDEDFQDDTQNEPQLENQDEETNLPIDYIRYNNQSKIETNKNNQVTPNNYNQRQVNNNVNTNNNINNSVNTTPNPVQTSGAVPSPPPPPPTPPEPPKPTVVQPPPKPKAPSPPPPVPSSSSSTVQVIVGSSGAVPPPPPPPPPPPIVPTVPTKASEAKAVKKNAGPELSLEEELAKAMSGLKKTVNLEEKPVKKELSFAEQLALSKAKLKKTVVPPKPPEKKVNPKDLLSQQIKLRFQNLRMHEDEKDEDSEDDDDF